MVAFDTELDDLDRDLKAKKQEIVDAELALKKLEHTVGLVTKERSSAEALKENLEKQFTWITDEHQSVLAIMCSLEEYTDGQILWQGWFTVRLQRGQLESGP